MRLIIILSICIGLGHQHGYAQISLPENVHALAAPDHTKRTVTYKVTQSGLALDADIISPLAKDSLLPVIVSIHGGGLMNGSKGIFPFPWKKLVKCGFVVMSINYRLAPESKLDSMIEDVNDAIDWIKSDVGRLTKIDTGKIALVGGSAGGFLSLQVANRRADIKAVVSLWGYPNIETWANTPGSYYLTKPIVHSDDAWMYYNTEVKAYRMPPGQSDFNAGRLYLHARQHGLWGHLVTGIDTNCKKEAYYKYSLSRNLSSEFPPVLFVHGQKDKDVPFEMVKRASQVIPDCILISSERAGHGFQNASPEEMLSMHEEVLTFLIEKLKSDKS